MFICSDCSTEFPDPELYIETHGLDTPPYEERYGCPMCGGKFKIAIPCDCCSQTIKGNYVQIDKDRFCENCYTKRNTDEDN